MSGINMGELPELLIQTLYDDIMKQLKDGKIYGYPINFYDIRQVVTAAYLLGGCKEQLKFMNHLRFEADMNWVKSNKLGG
jgi:hypothetical protein